MNKHIEVIEDNGGGVTIQNTKTKAVSYFAHKSLAIEELKAVLDGDDLSGWDNSEADYYITDEEFRKHAAGGGYRAWVREDIEEFLS